ncbi:MAG: Uma2 family endonuclease [Pyrinomonadaceae bacterium]
MSLPRTLSHFSPEEYLAFERGTDARHEYLDGHVYAMAGESIEHSRICVNVAGELRARLKGSPCEVLSPNMKVVTNPSGLFSYPDVVVVCGEPRFYDERRDILTNPTVVFEVLSPSTEAYDRGEKFLRYRTHIEPLREYVLVSQHRPLVEHYVRQPDGSWSYSSANSLDEAIDLVSIDCRLPLSEVYDRIVFPAGS